MPFTSDVTWPPFNSVGNEATDNTAAIQIVRQTLTLPNRFTLAGVGPDGEGSLSFEDLPDGASALRFASAAGSAIRMTTIRDIRISGEAR